MTTKARTRSVSLVIGVILLVLPFLAFWPYRWFVLHYAADSIVTPTIGREHQQEHLGIFLVITTFLFAALCFLAALILLLLNWRTSRLARWLVACVALLAALAVFVLISPFLGL